MNQYGKKKIIVVAGARPNFVKIAPLCAEISSRKEFELILVHTGQHYSNELSKIFFDELQIPEPHINLGVGSLSHAMQTSKIMSLFESVCLDQKPDLVIIVGDVNSTLACAIVASKLQISIAHVEAGLRSFDMAMPEEINRILTDRISDFLFITEESARQNLLHEGFSPHKIFFVGNAMIDTLVKNLEKISGSDAFKKLGLVEQNYAIFTLHRSENTSDEEKMIKFINILDKIQQKIKIIFPIHPRTQASFEKYGLMRKIEDMDQCKIIPALGYVEFLNLVKNSKFILTDSGGVQEETSFLGVPCITMRNSTERPITVDIGTNILVGDDREKILKIVETILSGKSAYSAVKPPMWDGKASRRIMNVIEKSFSLNILYVTGDKDIDPKGFDGKARHVQGTLKELKIHGYDIGLISNHLSAKKHYRLHEFAFNLLLLFKTILKTAFLKNRYDLIYERYCVNSLIGMVVSKIYKVPFFLEFNYSFIYGSEKRAGLKFRRFWFLIEKRILKSADRVFIVSLELEEFLLQIGVRQEKIVFAPIGVDVNFFDSKKVFDNFKKSFGFENKFVIGYVGSFQKYHGLDIILRAILKIKQNNGANDLRFVFVGDGSCIAEIKEQAKQMGLEQICFFTGKVPYENLPAVINSFDVALMTTPTYEQDEFFKKFHGFPAKILEYMAMEKPVIAPDTPTIRDYLIKNGANGFIIPPGDSDILAERILDLYGKKEMARVMGIGARQTVMQKYTWECKIKKIINSYKQFNYSSKYERNK